MRYPVESFTPEETQILARRFSNTDRPVFALVNLPEEVKGAMFARYSRYAGSLRRMYLDEFSEEFEAGAATSEIDAQSSERAQKLYERVFVGYGDDSIAQVGAAHIACESVSNVLTKIIQRGRLASYLEQSTRYIPFSQPLWANEPAGPENRKYYREADLGPHYVSAMGELFEIYERSLERVEAWVAEQFPRGEESERAWRGSVRAKALDLTRGILPAATLSNVGVFASGQAYEAMLLRMLSHPLPEARSYGQMILEELQGVIPAFVSRVDRPDRGGEWVQYLSERRARANELARRWGLDDATASGTEQATTSVRLLSHSGEEAELLAGELFELSGVSDERAEELAARLSQEERAEWIGELAGERKNRRHRPGRGWERVSYRFEIVSDYGAFRDLQRHRMLTPQWQTLTPHLGYETPQELREAGVADDYRRAMEISAREWERISDESDPVRAQYALCLGYRLRYVLELNAREAMQMIELRSGREGHPSYRAVALAMLEEIARVHPAIAAQFTSADRSAEPRLERLMGEIRTEQKRQAASGGELS